MDLSHLKFMTRKAFRKASAELLQNGMPKAVAWVIFDDDPQPKVFSLDGPGFNDARRRDHAFGALAEYCRGTKAGGLIIVSDGWTLHYSPAQRERLKADEAYRAAHAEITSYKGVVAAAAAGFGELREIVTATGQTSTEYLAIRQTYQRVAKDGSGVIPGTVLAAAQTSLNRIPPHTVRLDGKPEEFSSEAGMEVMGHMFQFYEGPKYERTKV